MKTRIPQKKDLNPFRFFPAPKSKSAIRKAMREIEKQTCVRFRSKKLRDEHYVRYISEPG